MIKMHKKKCVKAAHVILTQSKLLKVSWVLLSLHYNIKTTESDSIQKLSIYGRTNKRRELTALNRQGTQQQRPESLTVTPPGMRMNTGYINATKATILMRYIHRLQIGSKIMRMYLWWCLCTLYLLTCRVELPLANLVSVVVFLVCRALLTSFVCSNLPFVLR